jgi:uncharacterized protein (TIGR01777 family)
MKIIVTGGTGFIGNPLVGALLAAGHEVIVLTRGGARFPAGARAVVWDGKTIGPWKNEIDGADAVINLAGEPIAAKRWSADRKRKLEDSRLNATRAIVSCIREASRKPAILISGSAVGYYGDVENDDVTEARKPARDFLATVCVAWENEAAKAQTLGVRVVTLRTGIVLEKDGGALKKMLLPFKPFAGGPIGSGKQWMPWIHREDMIALILYALKNPVQGPLNATAPNPVTMKEFALTLGRTLHRPSFAPIPGFVLKIALGEMSILVLGGQKAVPSALLAAGFTFKYDRLREALSGILLA